MAREMMNCMKRGWVKRLSVLGGLIFLYHIHLIHIANANVGGAKNIEKSEDGNISLRSIP